MDDARILQIRDEVLSELSGPKGEATGALEARVAALERAVLTLVGPSGPAVSVVAVTTPPPPPHPSFRLLDVSGGTERCVLEPDKPCVQSGQCRQLGH